MALTLKLALGTALAVGLGTALVVELPSDANYLSALEYFKSGQTDLAVQELLAASGKPKFQDYSGDSIQSNELVYRAVGWPLAEAKAAAAYNDLPYCAELRDLSRRLVDLASAYRQAGDEPSAQAVLQEGAALGRRISEMSAHGQAVPALVGMAIERQQLEIADPSAIYDIAGQTVQSRLGALADQMAATRLLAGQTDALLGSLSDSDLVSFFDLMNGAGELAALRWAADQQDAPGPAPNR